MGTVGETYGYLCRGRGQNRARAGVWNFGVRRTGVGSCSPCRCDCSQHGRDGLLGRSPLLWKSCPTLSLLAFYSTPSSTLSDLPLPVLLLILILLCLPSTLIQHPMLVRLADVIFLAIQEVVDLIVALPLLLLPSLLLLASLAPQPHSLRAEGFGVGGSGTAVVH